jgi:hypothetical protein
MSKKSSIEWFNEQIINKQNGNGDSRSWDELLQHAKKMHKEETENAYWDGGQDIPSHISTCENYYNETYGGNK